MLLSASPSDFSAATVDDPIEASHLTLRYGSQTVLDDCSLAIPRGALLGLVGKNGSGKTTLIDCLAGLLEPSAGSSRVLGADSRTLPAGVKARIGYVPQRVMLPTWLTVGQMTDYFGSFYDTWDAEHIDSLVARWSLPTEKKIDQLSGGQKQLASIVAALGHRPEVLLLDEPVVGLDPNTRRDFLTLLGELSAESAGQLTVLFSTHLLGDLERVATHVALLADGRIRLLDELANLQESIVRLRITAAEPLPTPRLDALTLRASPQVVVATVRRPSEEIWRDWAAEHNAGVTAETLSLEDLFVELTGSSN